MSEASQQPGPRVSLLREGVARKGERNLHFAAYQSEEEVQVWYRGQLYRVPKQTGPRRAGAAARGAQEDTLRASMPGTILQVHVAPGDQVQAGQPVIVMESMKMELTLEAPRDGVVERLSCQKGQMIELGAELLRLEETK